MTCDYTRPGVEPWWHNSLAIGVFCSCGTRLNDTFGSIHPCPFGCERTAA